MNNTTLSALLIPVFMTLYMGGLEGSVLSCAVGLFIMSFIVLNVLMQKNV